MICESCIDAALDEAGGDLGPETAAFLATEMGADLPDHFCERLEEPKMECHCACGSVRPALREIPA